MTLLKFAAVPRSQTRWLRMFNAFRWLVLASGLWVGGCATDAALTQSDLRPMAGVYDGTLAQPNERPMRAGALVTEQGEFRLLGSNGMQVVAQLDRQDDVLSGGGRVFPAGEGRLADGSRSAIAHVEARVLPRGVISGTFTGGGLQGRFSLLRLPVSERGADLPALAGNYRSAREGSRFEGAIDGAGRLRGRDQHGIYNGQFDVLNPAVNLYRVHVTYRPFNGEPLQLSGLGTLNDDQTDGDRSLLQFQLSNDARPYFSQLRKVR